MSLSHFESHLSHLGTDFCIPPQEFVVERFGSDVVIARKLFGWLGGIGDPLQELLHFIRWEHVHDIALLVGGESGHFDNPFATRKERVVDPHAHVVSLAKFGATLSHYDISRFCGAVRPYFDSETTSSVVWIVASGSTRFFGSHPAYASTAEPRNW